MANSRAVTYGARRRTPVGAPTATPRRVENRVLDDLIGLRVQSGRRQALDWKAKKLGYKTAQDWIRACMEADFDQAEAEFHAMTQEGPLVAAS
ncbi:MULTISPECIES: hypothetical protein [Mycolicibacter]|uniref:Antitoxin VbhA domain-containing protein n=2 Tax=Mycolicibacter TaxID=1073531 RepID=A0ABU5XN74_9MYCO|nr:MULTISPECIES: hypothetical protein [unclassified Mycolicibacter]MEB3023433.1 hypothetical protein [Mycolicibacter sp. MYC098]MEB3033775.1 hypothetical protein [Mycolicibacter sp. MYC340]